MSTRGEIGAHLGRALAAALIGGVTGTLISFPWLLPRHLLNENVVPIDAASGAVMVAISLLFTLPSAVLLAAPLTWPSRGWIGDHVWLASLAYGAIGGGAGCAVSLLLDHGAVDPGGVIGAVYGAATAVGFVVMLRRTEQAPRDEESLESVFE